MTTFWNIPLAARPQTLRVNLSGNTYHLTFLYRDAEMGGWCLDIADVNGRQLVCGIPLVTGVDLLEQYGYMNFNGKLALYSDGDPMRVPSFEALGTTSHLVWITA